MIDKFTYESESFDIKELTKNKKALTSNEIQAIINHIEGRLSYIATHDSNKKEHVFDLIDIIVSLRKLI